MTDVLTKNSEWFKIKTHLDIQDELNPVFDEEAALKNVLSAAFKPPVKEEKSPSVDEMHSIMAELFLKPKKKRNRGSKHAFGASEKHHALHGVSLNPDRHA